MMATKKKKAASTRHANEIAEELHVVREQIKGFQKLEKSLTSELKEQMHTEQLRIAGPYELSTAHTLQVADEAVAYKWAQENNCLVPEKIDTSKAKEILRHTFDDPSKFGFAVVESERVVPTGRDEN